MGFFKRKPKHAAAPSSPLDEHGSALSPPQARYANSRTTSTSSVSVNSTARSASPLPPIPIEAAQQQQHPRHPSSHPARLANAPNARDRTRYYDDNNGDVDDAEGEQELERERQRQRERDDPSRWQLPGLGLSPPSLGLKLPSSRSNLANASSGSSEQSPEDVRNIGYGFPPTLTERRSFRSAMNESPTTYNAPSPSYLNVAVPSNLSRAASPSTAPSSATPTSSFFPHSSTSSFSAHTPATTDVSHVDDSYLVAPPPLSHSPAPSSPSSVGSSRPPPAGKRRFLGMFNASGGSSESGFSSNKGKERSTREEEPYGMSYDSVPHSYGPPTTTAAPQASSPSTAIGQSPRSHPSLTPLGSSTVPLPAVRRISYSRSQTQSPTSPSLSIEDELAQAFPPSASKPIPRSNRPPIGQRSTSFFSNALRVSIPSSAKNPSQPTDARPPSPAESFRVISARRITTPDESLLVDASGSGWLGARPRPSIGDRKRSQSHEWTRSEIAQAMSTSPSGGVEELRSPEKDKDGDDGGSRRMSVAAFRRRRSSAGFELDGNVLIIGREEMEAKREREGGQASSAAVQSDDDDDDDVPLALLRATGRSTPTPSLPLASPLPALSVSLPTSLSTTSLAASPIVTRPPVRPGHERGYSLSVPSPTVSSPSTVQGDPHRPITPTPTNPHAATAAAPPSAFPPRSSSLQSLDLLSADGDDAPFARKVESKSMPASPSTRLENKLPGRLPAPAVASLPVGSRPVRLDGPIARPPSRYEIAKAAAAARKPVESSSSSSDDKNASSSSDDDAPMRPASRASTAFRPRSPAVSLAVSRASTAKSPQEPLLTLPKELEKPVLDRQRSVRRASVGDADQILSDIASAKAAIASARPQPAYTMPLADFSSTAAASSTRATPVARRRGSESVLSRMDETRLSPPKEDDSDNTSDGYGNDDYSITPTGTAKRTFFKKPGKTVDEPLEIPAVAALPPGPARPASRQTSAFPLARSESDSDSEDQPLAQTRLPSQTPGRPQQTRRTLASTSNPALRVIAASPQTHLPPTAPTTKPTAPAPAPRHTSTTSLSTLASSSSSSSASSTAPARELPAPKSILRRTSFADDLGPATRPSRALVYSASNVPTTRPGMHNARSASTTSIPSPTTSTQFPPRPAFHAHPRSTGSPSSSSASGRTTGESSSGRTPLTPRESMDVELPKHGLGLGPRKMSSAALAAEEEDAPDEVELERRRNERRRNEAKKAVKLGNYANGTAPHPDDEEEEENDHPAAPSFPPFPQQMPFPQANPFAFGNPFAQFSPGGGMAGNFMDPNAMWAFQMQMQAQQAQMSMQMSMAKMGQSGDPSMQYQAMMVAKHQFQQAMAAQAAQMAGDQWELSSNMGGGAGGPMSEAGYPPSTMGGGMGMPNFNPAMNRFSTAGSLYGGYAASAYGAPDPITFQPQPQPTPQANYPSSRSDYGGVAPSSGKPRRDRFSSNELAPLPSRNSFYGVAYEQNSRSSHNLGPTQEQDYYQQSRIPPTNQTLQPPSYPRPRQSSNPNFGSSVNRTSIVSSKPLVSFSVEPPRQTVHSSRSNEAVPTRVRTTSGSNPFKPPSAPFVKEARAASPRSASPPSSWSRQKHGGI